MSSGGLRFTEFTVEFPFLHSTGPALGRFLGALRDRRILGRRCERCERVVVPADDHCDTCGGDLGAWTEVGPGGTVTAITTTPDGAAVALVRLDGAGTDVVHRAAPGLAAGDRVHPEWAAQREGAIGDLVRFAPGDDAAPAGPPGAEGDPVELVRAHLRLPFVFSAGDLGSRFSHAVRAGELYGVRCPSCRALYVPPRPLCPRCWERTQGWERVPDQGVVETFVVVNVPFPGQEIEIPYVLAHVRLDGADVSFLHLVGEPGPDGRLRPPPDGVRIGERVRAVWREPSARTGWLSEDVDHFAPSGSRQV